MARQTTDESVGIVARLVREKGFGFIKVEGSDEELFFHRSAVKAGAFDAMQEGATRVAFLAGEGPKGPRAENVRVVD